MLSLAHTATGAYLATKIPNPLLSIPLILASHYLEDYILHWDVGTGLSNGSKKPNDAFKHELIDLCLSFMFVFLIFQLPHSQLNYAAWLGAFTSLLPDFVEFPKNFLDWEPAFLKPFNQFHHHFHHSTANILVGLTPQLILLLFISLNA